MDNLNAKITLLASTILLTLTACGGGGGGSGVTPPPPPPPPVVRTPQMLAYSVGDGISANGLTEMYTIDDAGQNRSILSNPMTNRPSAAIEVFAISPDKQWVAYVSDEFTNLRWGSLYVAPIDGSSAAVRVSRQISNNGATQNRPVKSFQWSPDSTQLVYAANQDDNAAFFADEVFIVDRDGTNERKINGSIGNPAVVEVTNPQWSPDGRFIVQEVSDVSASTQAPTFALNVYDTTITTPNSRRLFIPRAPTDSTVIRNVRWSPDSTRISYMADQLVANQFNLFVIDVVSGANTQLTDNGDFNSDARWSPDGATIAYLDHPSAPLPSDLVASAGTAGAQDTVLAFLSPNGRAVSEYAWSPDGQQIAYTSDETTQDTMELYVVNSDGTGSATKVSGALTSNGDVFEFAWSPSGNSIAYVADQTTDTFQHLYVSSADGSSNIGISASLSGEEVVDFDWAADAERISFSTGPEGTDPTADKLYVAEPDGTGRQQINDAMDIGPLRFSYDE